jgi:HTH-type transcriptional repressor of NAD biosynthesis genes
MTMHSFRLAVVAGKFLPPHVGHHALIDFAVSIAQNVIVLVVDGHGERPPADRRALWIQTIHPTADVVVAADLCCHGTNPCVPDCSVRWATWLTAALQVSPDVVVSSEGYGPLFAEQLGASHVVFDADRSNLPVSGTAIRTGLVENWINLHPIVRAGLHRQVTVVGAESTGTTTLARDLALALGAPIALEAGRISSWVLAARAGGWNNVSWTISDFRRILADQRRLEADASHLGAREQPGELGPWIVADTDALATVAWWERYLGKDSDEALQVAHTNLADIYIVTDPSDVDFVQDGLRDGEHVRWVMHERFCELAYETGRPVEIVTGNRDERLAIALDALRQYERRQPRFVTTDNTPYSR